MKKIKETEKSLGKKKTTTFDAVAGKMSKKNKAATFYDMLLLAKQEKIELKQSKPFADIQITVY
jgi:chromatin segregation and condensation protein Rec8/ScpA/Scc1 (kleisin family)